MTGKAALVTVILPVRDGGEFLDIAIESLLAQSFEDLEVIVVDDGAGETERQIIASIADARVRILHNPTSIGLTRSLNRAIDETSGDLIARMDADDVSLPSRIATQVSYMKRNPDVVACGTWAIDIDERGNFVRRRESPRGPFLDAGHWWPSPIIHPSAMFRRTPETRYDETLPYAQDFDLWFRLSRLGRLANIPDYLLLYRVHPDSITSARANDQVRISHEIFRNHVGREPDDRDWHLNDGYGVPPWTRFRSAWSVRRTTGVRVALFDDVRYTKSWFRRKLGPKSA